jgi:hypothetical protein
VARHASGPEQLHPGVSARLVRHPADLVAQ